MKKYLFFCIVMAALMCSCSLTKKHHLHQLTYIEPYLWELTIEDYSDSIPLQYIAEAGSDFQCSAVRNGNFYGRNLDFFISEIGEIVVHTPAKNGRHASVGIARTNKYTDEQLAKGLTDEELTVTAWGMFDGINDAGLFCNMNVVPYEDGGTNPGTNPGKPTLLNFLLVRALLDNCATVEDAIDYVNSHNIVGKEMGGFNLHFMIGDPENTVILEFINNKAVFVADAEKNHIMTNFYISALPELTPLADGVERYNILREHYAEGGESVDGMYNLMHRVRFSQAYDPDVEPFWASEYTVNGRSGYFSTKDSILANEKVQRDIANFQHYRETGEYNREDALWFTEHVSVYDIAKRELTVTVHENYTEAGKHTFGLSAGEIK